MKDYFEKIKSKSFDDIMYIVWGIYISTTFLDIVALFFSSEILKLGLKSIRYICYIIYAIKIIYDWKKGEKITLPIIGVGILSVMILIFTHNSNILLTFLILIALRKEDFNKLINITLKIFITYFFIVVSLSIFDIIPNWEFSRGIIPRYALGFIYATDAIGTYLVIILMYFYIRNSKATYIELIILETINIFIFEYTNGRASFLLISMILIIQLLCKCKFMDKFLNTPFVQKILKLVCYTLPTLLFITFHILICMYAINNNLANKVNKALSDRVKYTYQAYRNYDVNLFGSDIDWKGYGGYGYTNLDEIEEFEYNFVDNSYAVIVFNYGIIFATIVLIGYTYILIINYEKKNYNLIFTIFFVLIWSFIEQYIIEIGKNVFVLAFIPLLQIQPINWLNYDNVVAKIKNNNKKEECNENK